MDEGEEAKFFWSRRTDKTYAGSRFPDFAGRPMRIADKTIEGGSGYRFVKVKDEVVVRETPAGRYQIKATFLEDDRSFQTITIQRFTEKGNAKEHFTLLPGEVAKLLQFLSNIRRIHFPHAGSLNVFDHELEDLLLEPAQAKRLFIQNQELLAALARTEVTERDIVALGYRKRQIECFRRMLEDEEFAAKAAETAGGVEAAWQSFFEKNPWIFGYGLSLINFGPLDGRKMEQVVRGADVFSSGKRVDALLKSHAVISTTCFVEIKTHSTDLVSGSSYRSGIWKPSSELSGAVSQVQGTVAAALEQWRSEISVPGADGMPTGEQLFTTEPRSFVVCGSLAEFQSEDGVNAARFKSFELYRRNLVRPEVVTFDELYERARLIVEAEVAEQD